MDKNISLSNTGQMQQVIHVSWIEVEICYAANSTIQNTGDF